MAPQLSAALVGSALAAAGASAPRAVKLGGNQLYSAAAADALLQKARPYRRTSAGISKRRLDQNNFEVDGSYSLKFSQCVDVKLMDRDLFDEDVIEYTKEGQIISAQSYVLFHLCQGDNCYYESEEDLYLIDLPTYVQNVASYHANIQSSYCDACDMYYYNFCVAQNDDANQYAANDDAAAANDDGAANDDMGNYYQGDDAAARKLGARRRTTQYIDCDQCQAYGCVNSGNDDGQQQGGDEGGAAGMIEDISQCLKTGVNWNNEELYVGLMCSNGGSGVELAVFLDNECTVYTSLKAFSDIPSYYIYNDADMFAEAEAYIKSAFTETTPCLYEEFGNPAYQSNGDDDANAQNNGDDGYQTNDYCQNIFDEGAISFDSCGQNDDQNNNNQNAADDDNYSWYTYDMDYDDARDLDQVCSVLQQLEGEYDYQYDPDNSGSWNSKSRWGSKSNNKKKDSSGRWGFLGERSAGFSSSGMMILFYVVLGVAIVVGVLFLVGVYERRKRGQQMEPFYSGGRLV